MKIFNLFLIMLTVTTVMMATKVQGLEKAFASNAIKSEISFILAEILQNPHQLDRPKASLVVNATADVADFYCVLDHRTCKKKRKSN